MASSVDAPDWSTIPAPTDDGAAAHLAGVRLPAVALASTAGSRVDLSALPGRTVVFVYPRTGRPGVDNPPGWDLIPGARGCTPQACSFRDLFADLRAHGVGHVFGLSTQATDYQAEVAARVHLPFPLLSDDRFELTRAIRLPTFDTSGMTLLKRVTLVIDAGMVTRVFYPVFPPDRSAADVLKWLKSR